jgi:multisubunit Na+/H+ antiporter MnhG subunit
MVWLGAVLFILIGLGLLAARDPLARALGLTLGGRLGAGCIVAIATAFFVVAVLVVVFREMLR